MEHLVPLLWLWTLFFVINVLWILSQAAVARTLGERPVRVELGFGPVLLSGRLGGTRWFFRPLTIGSAVSFGEVTEGAPRKERLQHLSSPLYVAVILLPWGVQVLIAMACLGASEGLHHFVHGFALPFELSALPGRVERFLALLQHGELLQAWGLMSAKIAAINLLPLPFFSGGQVLLTPWRKQFPDWVGPLSLLSFLTAAAWALYVAYLVLTTVF